MPGKTWPGPEGARGRGEGGKGGRREARFKSNGDRFGEGRDRGGTKKREHGLHRISNLYPVRSIYIYIREGAIGKRAAGPQVSNHLRATAQNVRTCLDGIKYILIFCSDLGRAAMERGG